jgi:mono/diheme cytochrome c family protein
MKQHIKRVSITIFTILILLIGVGSYFIYSGIYNIGADDPHSKPVFALLQTLRNRSIEARAASLAVPNLDDPQIILKGAGQYAAMCTSCHLTPGDKDSEIRPGLYPQPPDLTQTRVAPKEAFWVIKHGIKMSAMPAWGGSHDDATIWSMVAFLQKLPDMSPSQYKEIVDKAPPDDDMTSSPFHSHSHGGAGHEDGGHPSESGHAHDHHHE